jgi:hypothetical protein
MPLLCRSPRFFADDRQLRWPLHLQPLRSCDQSQGFGVLVQLPPMLCSARFQGLGAPRKLTYHQPHPNLRILCLVAYRVADGIHDASR